jgi:hypothetical protein
VTTAIPLTLGGRHRSCRNVSIQCFQLVAQLSGAWVRERCKHPRIWMISFSYMFLPVEEPVLSTRTILPPLPNGRKEDRTGSRARGLCNHSSHILDLLLNTLPCQLPRGPSSVRFNCRNLFTELTSSTRHEWLARSLSLPDILRRCLYTAIKISPVQLKMHYIIPLEPQVQSVSFELVHPSWVYPGSRLSGALLDAC